MSTSVDLTSILAAAIRDPAFVRLCSLIDEKDRRHINLSGMTESQKAYLIAALIRKTGRSAAIIVADELKARTLRADLAAFLGEEDLPVLRPRDTNLADVEASSRDAELSRLGAIDRILHNSAPAFILSAGALPSRLMTPEDFLAQSISLRIGSRIAPDVLAAQLVEIGYERMRTVEGEGEFAQRGDIFDVYPVGCEEPVRISFFDEDIDQIKHFDLETQRSTEKRSDIRIAPAREIFVPDTQRGVVADRILVAGENLREEAIRNGASAADAEDFSRLALQDAERIRAGVHFPGLEKWVRLILPDNVSVLSYLRHSDVLLFVDETLHIKKRLDGVQADFHMRFKSLFEKRLVPYTAAEAVWKGTEIFASLDNGGQVISLAALPSSGNGFPGGANLTITGSAVNSYRGHEAALTELVRERNRSGLDTVLMAGVGVRADRLRAYLAEQGASVNLSSSHMPSGFTYPAAQLMVIGTQDIFGVDRPLRKKKGSGVHIDLFSDLVPGELVVHEQHGIGRYDGMVNMEAAGVRRDYLKISYASDDALYISMENLDQIQKYVGSEGREPKLSRLGGQEWTRMKEKARTSIRQLAFSLVELYAKRQANKGFAFSPDSVWQREFEEDFPYQETEDQLSAIADIKRDMESEKVMDRLLCGDVGFGKTEVAFRAIFKCVNDGKQAILLAPTTVLVQQHFENLHERMARFPVKVALLSRFANPAMIKQAVKGLNDGSVDVVVGTHRVLSKDIIPKNLGLLVIDEEQRFGVEHKEKLKHLRSNVDVLTLTATPIPRTLHMSLSGIRDISVLEEPPLDRRPVQTYVMEYDEQMIEEACLREISREGQIFYLFNDTRRIEEKAAALEKALPGARVLFAHGKMSERQLENIIESFIFHEADILVCTTIIESGIDMPNVNTIIVEDADRFGLAQLYQLRGRVGRSDRQAYAYITYRRDKILTEIAEKRLTAIRDFTELGSGIKIALRDMEVRGAGNLLGPEQHGQMDVIGYDLYCRMLEEEVRSIRGEVQPEKHEAVVDMDVDAYIPADYIADAGQRMDAYRRIGSIASTKEYFDVIDELTDRFGDVPAKVQTLTDISYIRAMAAKHGFSRVHVKSEAVLLYYVENARPDMEALSRILSHPRFKGRILFSSVQKPYVQYRPIPEDRGKITERLVAFFQILEGNDIRGVTTDEVR